MRTYSRINKKIIEILQNGSVAVIPTDTIYGIVGSALNQKTVRRIYKLRKRNPKKPMIILIGSIDDLKQFGIALNSSDYSLLAKYWPAFTTFRRGKPSFAKASEGKPGAVSIILPISARRLALRNKLRYLHRGANALAFRLPTKKSLRALLKKTGPLVAPSANWEGYPPAKNIKEAKKYFKNGVDVYIDPVRGRGALRALAASNGVDGRGTKRRKPSRLIEIRKGIIKILR